LPEQPEAAPNKALAVWRGGRTNKDMLTWIMPRLILLPFCLGLCFVGWSLRFFPPFPSRLVQGIVQLMLALGLGGGVIAEVLLYSSLTGQERLADDNFFFVIMMVQSIIASVIAVKSGSILKKKRSLSH
jgi:hypothetical protein